MLVIGIRAIFGMFSPCDTKTAGSLVVAIQSACQDRLKSGEAELVLVADGHRVEAALAQGGGELVGVAVSGDDPAGLGFQCVVEQLLEAGVVGEREGFVGAGG